MKLHVLAFGAHPDDVELGCAGTLMVEIMDGKQVGIIDLTEGELGTRGSIEERQQEAADASAVLGIKVRENLGLPDGFFQNDKGSQLKVITAIRKYQPEIILANALEDRHPDHGRAARLIADSAFLAGLSKIETFNGKEKQDAWRPKYVFHYTQDRYLKPDFLVDITSVFDKKIEAIKAFRSQFYHKGITGPQTYISTPEFWEGLISRHRLFGKKIGVEFAEGFQSEKMLGIPNFSSFIQRET